MKKCKFQDCAVCKQFKNRDVFKNIFKIMHPDVLLCNNVIYKVTGNDGKSYTFDNIDIIKQERKGLFIVNMFSGERIKITKDNFEILCDKEDNCSKEPETIVYKKDG